MRAAVGLALSGRYAAPAAQAAHGLREWANGAGVELSIVDTTADESRIEAFYRQVAGEAELLFGPYGSGPLRAAERGLEGQRAVLWNHGGAAGGATRSARVVDVLGPATTYWRGLAAALIRHTINLDAVVIVHADSPFGRETSQGAVRSLAAAGAEPMFTATFDQATAPQVVGLARERGAACVIGCGRIEDDLALIHAATAAALPVGAIVAGVGLSYEKLGAAVVGAFGPAQWFIEVTSPLGPDAEYPAAQAFGAGQIAMQAYERAESAEPEALWDAARSLRCGSILGPFQINARGRQLAHSPLIVEWVATSEGPRRQVIWRP